MQALHDARTRLPLLESESVDVSRLANATVTRPVRTNSKRRPPFHARGRHTHRPRASLARVRLRPTH